MFSFFTASLLNEMGGFVESSLNTVTVEVYKVAVSWGERLMFMVITLSQVICSGWELKRGRLQ